ncbi:DNA/RNA non-specific endonuclease [Piscirickettsia litoralis]|uniref:Endonuclease n=1 Tax=Piscirickettsia litoralis TaxID=1891921 RepID=A0ABX2ZYG0_9GAMM|nr:DNA/RNA non-specific endonuclease [Piscirickettsia litoralis]ODN41424.1 DNA/RNA endonuclease [Piscirickettsia litoralis]
MKALANALLISFSLSTCTIASYAANDFQCHDFLKYGTPSKADQYLCRRAYTVGYNYKTKQPAWVAFKLTGQSVSKRIKRHNQFMPDPTIPQKYRSELSDWKKSGYDRGHLASYASMDFNKESAKESFYLSNMSPQKAGLNRQGWARLESDVRFWAKYKGEVYVYTGPIFQGKKIKTIGKSKVAVPTSFFKIIYAPKQQQTIAFVMPNKRVAKNKVADYRTNIQHIERLTGFKFLSALPATEQEKLSSTTSKMWKTHYG